MKEKPSYAELEYRLREAESEIESLKSGSPDHRNETLYSNLMENSIDAVYLLSEKGDVLEVNSVACKMLNYSRDELLAMNIGDIDPNYDREGFQFFWAPRPEEETLLFETKHRRKDDTSFPVEVNGIAFELEGEKLLYGVARDITQRKNAEAKLRKSEEQFRVLAESSPIGIYQTDKEGKCVYANPKWQEMADMSLKECLGDNWAKALHEKDLEIIQKKWNETVKSGKTWEHEYRFKRKDGKQIWVYGSATPIKDEEGNITGYIGSNIDITQRKRAEEALAESEEILRISEERFNLAINATNDGLWDWKYGTDEIYFNRRWKEMLGYKEEEIANSFAEWERLTHPDDVEESFKVLQEHIEGKRERFEMEFRMKHKQGHWMEILSRAEVIFDREQKPYRVIGTHVDLSRIRKIEKELRNSEERYRELVETINSGVAIYQVQNEGKLGKDYIIKSFNKTALEIENKSLKEVVGKSLHDLRPNIDKYGLIDIFRKVWETGKTAFYPAKVYVDEQYSNWYENRVFRLPSGEIVAIYDDVTERQQALEALKESEKQFRNIIQQAGDGILIADRQGRFLDANNRALADLGYKREELMELSVFHIDKEVNPEKYEQELWQKTKNASPFSFETHHLRKDGSVFPAEVIVSRTTYAGKEALIGVARDLSERKKYLQELQTAKEKAEESDRLKSAFMANMSHEIRTPLNGILGFSKLVCDPDTENEEKERYSNIILNSGQRLLSVVNDILDISLIQANQLKLSREKINIRTFLTELYTFYQTLMGNQMEQVDFTVNAENIKEDLCLIADKNRLYQILKNLLDNAFKFTKKGSIEFGYYPLSGNSITFYVKDTGIGIPKDKQKQIFRAFEKADTSLSPEFGGTGLGLSIASGLVNRMGGKIWVESQSGKGAGFIFELPLERSESVSLPNLSDTQKSLNLEGRHILIVEDDLVSFELLAHLLEGTHARITHAGNAEEGLRILEKESFDLVFMDIRLPGMDGYEATRKIREKHGKIPVIAQTAYAMQGDARKALDAGCDDYLSKPIDKNMLYQKLNKMLRSTAGEEV